MEKIVIKTLAKFVDDVEKEFPIEYLSQFFFDINEIASFNDSNEGMTTIELKSGCRQTVEIEFDKFIQLYETHTCFKIIESVSDKAMFEFKEKN